MRLEDAVHFRKANGEHTAIFGKKLNWTDAANQIVPVAPELWQTEAGYREIGTPTVVRIVAGKSQDTIEMYDAVTGKVVTVYSPKLERTGDWTFRFPWESIYWTLAVTPFGWTAISDPVAAARGVRTYNLPLASSGFDPQPDATTGDLVDGNFRLTRAVMVAPDVRRRRPAPRGFETRSTSRSRATIRRSRLRRSRTTLTPKVRSQTIRRGALPCGHHVDIGNLEVVATHDLRRRLPRRTSGAFG